MSSLQFLASVINSVAWPVVVGLAIFVFRKPMIKLVESIRSVSLKDTTLSFDGQAKEAKAATAAEIVVKAPKAEQETKFEGYSYVEKISTLWSYLIRGVTRNLTTGGHPIPGNANDGTLLKYAFANGVLSQDQFKSLNGLYHMRNLAVHRDPAEIDEKRYTDFAVIAATIGSLIDVEFPFDPLEGLD